jgi:hypothetical protein
MEYVSEIPQEIPAGKILVHHRVRPVRRLGTRGFRAWLTMRAAEHEPCDCAWAPALKHFRVKDLPRKRPWASSHVNGR